METPPQLRGQFYPTKLKASCPAFHQCLLCQGCQNYNRHNLECNICESIKPINAICVHNDAQQYTMVRMAELTRQPMAHPDKRGTSIEIPIAGNDAYEQIINSAVRGEGAIAPVQRIEESNWGVL